MTTIYACLLDYCEHNKLPPPTLSDLNKCGIFISKEFRKWVLSGQYSLFNLGDLIPQAGFIIEKQGDITLVVNVYPDEFAPKIRRYFSQLQHFKGKPKEVRKPVPKTGKKERRKIPIGAKKVWSSEGGKSTGQIIGLP